MQNEKTGNTRPKNYLETKFSRAAAVTIYANKFRDDPKKLAEFISKNPTYFPKIDKGFVDLISKASVKEDEIGSGTGSGPKENKFLVAKFSDINSEFN